MKNISINENLSNSGLINFAANPESNNSTLVNIYIVAKRMFMEGMTKSTILRITGLSEQDYFKLVKEI